MLGLLLQQVDLKPLINGSLEKIFFRLNVIPLNLPLLGSEQKIYQNYVIIF